jgi:hypothetical protein
VIRTSNGYRFLDPIEREPGRKAYKSENRTGPQNTYIKKEGGGGWRRRVIQKDALQGEPGSGGGAKLTPAERAALIVRLDTNPTKTDWALWSRDLEARLT